MESHLNDLQAKRCKDNLPPEERSALKTSDNTAIIIKPADKGSTVVVLSKEDYIKEASWQLNESVYYQKLPADPTSQYTMEVKQCVDSMYRRELIDKKVKHFLVPHYPRAGRFYLLPKIHKPGNLGRPLLLPLVPRQKTSHASPIFFHGRAWPSYIWDTRDFINKLRRVPQLPPGCLLVTLDVSSLYTNIPHEQGIITACEEFLYCQEKQEPPMTTSSMIEVYWRHLCHMGPRLTIFKSLHRKYQPITILLSNLQLCGQPKKWPSLTWGSTWGTARSALTCTCTSSLRTHISTSEWIAATHKIANPRSLTVKRFASDESVQRKNIFRSGSANSRNIY